MEIYYSIRSKSFVAQKIKSGVKLFPINLLQNPYVVVYRLFALSFDEGFIRG